AWKNSPFSCTSVAESVYTDRRIDLSTSGVGKIASQGPAHTPSRPSPDRLFLMRGPVHRARHLPRSLDGLQFLAQVRWALGLFEHQGECYACETLVRAAATGNILRAGHHPGQRHDVRSRFAASHQRAI